MNNLIAFLGRKRAGKDTAAQFFIDNYDYKRLAFADEVDNTLIVLDPFIGYDYGENKLERLIRYSEAKRKYSDEYIKEHFPEYRRLKQVMGTEVGRDMFGSDVWIERAFASVVEPSKLVITDLRFPNEALAVRERGGLLIRINRPDLVSNDNHRSETEMDSIQPDLIISNHGTILELHERLIQFVVQPLSIA